MTPSESVPSSSEREMQGVPGKKRKLAGVAQHVRFQARLLWARTGYRPTARAMHRFGFHHTRKIGPLMPDGAVVHRCDWCGVSRTEHTMASIERKMKEASRA